jgi:hypothetical protein
MMLKLAKLGIAIAVLATLIVPAAYAGVPDVTQSYFVPQATGTAAAVVGVPCEGPVAGANGCAAAPAGTGGAIGNARRCPNDDGTQVLKNNSRLKIVVRASDGSPIAGIPASDICVLFNGGVPAQGFSGVGDDSIIANFQFNSINNCPDVRCVQADAATDVNGETYITWLGTTVGSPGVATRDPLRKWGMYAGDLPVMVLGFKLQGKLASSGPLAVLGNYTAFVKSLDHVRSGLPLSNNLGELVNSLDINPVQAAAAVACASQVGPAYKYNLDFDNSGCVNSVDLNLIKAHNNHRCNSPLPN